MRRRRELVYVAKHFAIFMLHVFAYLAHIVVIQKYFELIPQAQQYGITQWCATDSPKDSGWRPGCPTGLWDSNYLRKHTYAGFAAGLGAPEYWKDAK